jgi:DNA invertase Pin-like site-specific DNA recombinase
MAKTKFVAYYRVSTKQQGSSGLGMEAQERAVAEFLAGRAGVLAGFYADVESGTRKGNKRPELAKAIAQCRRDKGTLLIAKLDRLARNVAFVSNLMESGIEFLAVDMPQANKFTIHILAAVAEYEAEMISKRTIAALASAKARGVQLGKPENLTPEARARSAQDNRDKAMAAYALLERRMANLRAKGMALQAIAEHMNENGETTRQGAPFTAMTIKRIIDRARVASTG